MFTCDATRRRRMPGAESSRNDCSFAAPEDQRRRTERFDYTGGKRTRRRLPWIPEERRRGPGRGPVRERERGGRSRVVRGRPVSGCDLLCALSGCFFLAFSLCNSANRRRFRIWAGSSRTAVAPRRTDGLARGGGSLVASVGLCPVHF